MAVRNPPCSSSNSNSSLEGNSATLHKCMHAFLFFLSLSSSQLRFLLRCWLAGCLRSRVLRDWLPAITVHGRPGAAIDGLGNLSLGTALIGHDGSPLAWSSNALAACRSAWCSMALAACHSAQRLTASAACWSASVDGYGRAFDSATRSAASQKLAAWLCLPLHLAFDGYGTACRSLALTASAAC